MGAWIRVVGGYECTQCASVFPVGGSCRCTLTVSSSSPHEDVPVRDAHLDSVEPRAAELMTSDGVKLRLCELTVTLESEHLTDLDIKRIEAQRKALVALYPMHKADAQERLVAGLEKAAASLIDAIEGVSVAVGSDVPPTASDTDDHGAN